jgi:adenylate kinase family enzyme
VAAGGDFRAATRIAVYGVTGSGKTRAAAIIGAVTGLPWHAVDDLTWEPGWVEVPRDEQRRRIERICRGDAWILDSIHRTWMDVVLDRVEVIVALDYPRWLSYGRLLRRTATRMVTREPVCNGNVESLGNVLARDSILWFHFRSFGRKRRRIRAWADDPAAPQVQQFTGPRQLALALAFAGPTPPG